MLRGILATYVMLGHCRWLLWAGHSAWLAAPHARIVEPIVYASAAFRYGRQAVMVFFVLSGFFIHLRAAQSAFGEQSFRAGAFYARRLHRLGAPYAFALVITVILDLVGRSLWPTLYSAQTGDALVDGVFARTGYEWRSIVPAFMLLPSSLGIDFGTNGPLWSLAYEVVYYALYPAWLALRRTSPAAAYLVVPAACLIMALVPPLSFLSSVLALYPVWLIGAALAEIVERRDDRIPIAAGLSAFAAGAVVHVVPGPPVQAALAAMLYGGGAVAVFSSLPQDVNARNLSRVLEYLGVRSYSIYITHFPFVALMSAMLFASGGRPYAGWVALAGAVLSLAFGCACFAVCERHFVHHRAPAVASPAG